jgi:superfamily II DNA or RNA helicase
MAGHYIANGHLFSLFSTPAKPGWRAPQRGALGALVSHWSIPGWGPALVSLPTGAGKTAVAVAAPYVAQAARVLVVVPSRDLRAQTVDAFSTETVLRRIGARDDGPSPSVLELTGLSDDWSLLRDADVVVALPNSISPHHYEGGQLPPSDLFDLIVIDEAHHAPAATWRAILDHFDANRALLLTATPTRRDRRRVPGDHIYHYPLRQALEDGIYQPIEAALLDLPQNAGRDDVDRLIASSAIRIFGTNEHETSAMLIRASDIARANVLADLYRGLGLAVDVLHSRLGPNTREAIVERLRTGESRAVVIVDMLGEGFDLPRLRIAAYHDKHKSLTSTVQLIGRLVRADPEYPQRSVVVAAKDIDVYPQLRGAARTLYEEDPDWLSVLPDLVDGVVTSQIEDRAYANSFAPAPPMLAVEALRPVSRAVLHEATTDWVPEFASGTIPDQLEEGQLLRGQTILYSAVNPDNSTLVIVTASVQLPRWHTEPGLESTVYDLHIVSWRPARQRDHLNLLLVNSADTAISRQLLEILGAPGNVQRSDPQRLQEAFDSLDRISVSNIGVRNTYLATRGAPSYRMYSGSGVDRGLRDSDTARSALGHAVAQVAADGGSAYTAGIATEKSKVWESRYVSLRVYEEWVNDLVERYWFPPPGGPGRLLPNVVRGARLTRFPSSAVAAIELNASIYGAGWAVAGRDVAVEDLDFQFDGSQASSTTEFPIRAFEPGNEDVPIWRGMLDVLGQFRDTTRNTWVHRGWGIQQSLGELLTDRPPSIYFLDGHTVIGTMIYESRNEQRQLPEITYINSVWSGVDVRAETKTKALERGKGTSIHEHLELYLKSLPRIWRLRWVLCNDGPKEIADYIVIQMKSGQPARISLWHAKAAQGDQVGVRINDLQVVAAQAIKSRRWITDRLLWHVLGARLSGDDTPPLTVIEGNERLLRTLCGKNPDHLGLSIANRPPVVDGEIGIAQPGLGMTMLKEDLSSTTPSNAARQIRELLTVWRDASTPISSCTLLTSE